MTVEVHYRDIGITYYCSSTAIFAELTKGEQFLHIREPSRDLFIPVDIIKWWATEE